ncbi:MAG TPA: Uma2 family endonuclease [Gemmataceae bacterium]|nr:Uma2 family endonuclease [Gemmataceae bacterium]
MNQIVRPELLPKSQPDDEPLYGWRYVKRTQPDGTEKYEEVPLRKEDLLYPEEEDRVVQKPPHMRDLEYCHVNLRAWYRDDPSVVVLGDCRIDFGVPGLQPLGPDVTTLFGVRQWLEQGTFRVSVEGGRPVLVIEITSPSTQDTDVGPKTRVYHRAGVPLYIIVDRGPRGNRPARLIGRRRTARSWSLMRPDSRGRLSLTPIPLSIGIEDELTWFYDADGNRLPDPVDSLAAAREAEQKARDEAKARKKAEAKAKRAEKKAREVAAARAEMEQRVRELEEQVRRQQGQS